jgi:GR25 family glycosyltransferase involved in LPS biosynthesis
MTRDSLLNFSGQTIELIYILGIPNKFRGKDLMTTMQRLGFCCKVIAGLDAKLLSDFQASEMVNKRAARIVLGREITIGEACCSLVHLQAYRELLKTDKEWVLILEDDALLLDEDIRALSFPPNVSEPSILKLSSPTPEDSYVERMRTHDDYSIEAARFKKLRFPTNMAHAYLINRAAAKIAVRKTDKEKIHFTADWPYIWDANVSFWQSEHGYFSQFGESVIDSDNSRSKIISTNLPTRSLNVRLRDFLRDFLFVNSVLLFLYGGSGLAYYKSRNILKLRNWSLRVRNFCMRYRYPI